MCMNSDHDGKCFFFHFSSDKDINNHTIYYVL